MAVEFQSCCVDGCNRNAHRRVSGRAGLCHMHYRRQRLYGDPLGGRTPNGEPLKFVLEVVLPYQGGECLLWPFSDDGRGYARLQDGDKPVSVHRYVCTLVNGEPPTPEHEAAHNCGKGNLGCVTPGHLEWKTPAENCADKLIHGTHQRGVQNGRAKITEAEAREILRMRGSAPLRVIAAEFGVSISAVNQIYRGCNWSWIEP